jgi:hypothetical protein
MKRITLLVLVLLSSATLRLNAVPLAAAPQGPCMVSNLWTFKNPVVGVDAEKQLVVLSTGRSFGLGGWKDFPIGKTTYIMRSEGGYVLNGAERVTFRDDRSQKETQMQIGEGVRLGPVLLKPKLYTTFAENKMSFFEGTNSLGSITFPDPPKFAWFMNRSRLFVTFEDRVEEVLVTADFKVKERKILLAKDGTRGTYNSGAAILVVQGPYYWLPKLSQQVAELPFTTPIQYAFPVWNDSFFISSITGQDYILDAKGSLRLVRQVGNMTLENEPQRVNRSHSVVALISVNGTVDYFDKNWRSLPVYGPRHWQGMIQLHDVSDDGRRMIFAYASGNKHGVDIVTYQDSCSPESAQAAMRTLILTPGGIESWQPRREARGS